MDKMRDIKIITRFLRDMQGSRRYKGIDKLSMQYRQQELLKRQDVNVVYEYVK